MGAERLHKWLPQCFAAGAPVRVPLRPSRRPLTSMRCTALYHRRCSTNISSRWERGRGAGAVLLACHMAPRPARQRRSHSQARLPSLPASPVFLLPAGNRPRWTRRSGWPSALQSSRRQASGLATSPRRDRGRSAPPSGLTGGPCVWSSAAQPAALAERRGHSMGAAAGGACLRSNHLGCGAVGSIRGTHAGASGRAHTSTQTHCASACCCHPAAPAAAAVHPPPPPCRVAESRTKAEKKHIHGKRVVGYMPGWAVGSRCAGGGGGARGWLAGWAGTGRAGGWAGALVSRVTQLDRHLQQEQELCAPGRQPPPPHACHPAPPPPCLHAGPIAARN